MLPVRYIELWWGGWQAKDILPVKYLELWWGVSKGHAPCKVLRTVLGGKQRACSLEKTSAPTNPLFVSVEFNGQQDCQKVEVKSCHPQFGGFYRI